MAIYLEKLIWACFTWVIHHFCHIHVDCLWWFLLIWLRLCLFRNQCFTLEECCLLHFHNIRSLWNLGFKTCLWNFWLESFDRESELLILLLLKSLNRLQEVVLLIRSIIDVELVRLLQRVKRVLYHFWLQYLLFFLFQTISFLNITFSFKWLLIYLPSLLICRFGLYFNFFNSVYFSNTRRVCLRYRFTIGSYEPVPKCLIVAIFRYSSIRVIKRIWLVLFILSWWCVFISGFEPLIFSNPCWIWICWASKNYRWHIP